jgi:hypothetical protein
MYYTDIFPSIYLIDFAQDYSLMMSMKAGTVHSILTHSLCYHCRNEQDSRGVL